MLFRAQHKYSIPSTKVMFYVKSSSFGCIFVTLAMQ